ncbi:hypothetical protein ACWGLG_41980 [Streptomyces antimycoticus]
MSKEVVTLPDIPKAGEELEDYIAALFQASDHFVEKQIVESDSSDILELDIFATDYGSEKAVRRLIEVKGGKWGFTDLFKVVGWMQYLSLEHGAFFMTRWDDRTSAPRKVEPLGLDVVCFNDFGAASQLFTEKGVWILRGTVSHRSVAALVRSRAQVRQAHPPEGASRRRRRQGCEDLPPSDQQRHLLRQGPGGVAGASLRRIQGAPQTGPGLRTRNRRGRLRPARGRERQPELPGSAPERQAP